MVDLSINVLVTAQMSRQDDEVSREQPVACRHVRPRSTRHVRRRRRNSTGTQCHEKWVSVQGLTSHSTHNRSLEASRYLLMMNSDVTRGRELLTRDSWLHSSRGSSLTFSWLMPRPQWLVTWLATRALDSHESCFPGTKNCIDSVSLFQFKSCCFNNCLFYILCTCTGMSLFFVFPDN